MITEKLALKVYQSGWEFDTILCLARGGLRPGDILSRIFNKPLAIMSTSSYRAEAITRCRADSRIARFITTPKGSRLRGACCWSTIWLTRDTRSMRSSRCSRRGYTPITELRSAVIWLKGVSTFTPDYLVEFLPTNPWIHQPLRAMTTCTRTSSWRSGRSGSFPTCHQDKEPFKGSLSLCALGALGVFLSSFFVL